MTRQPINWPRRHPHNKRYMQLAVGRDLTDARLARISALIAKWEPILFAKGVNVPGCLMEEHRRLSGLRVDWSMFPKWVRRDG
jgi:hypothetical protein